MNLPEVNITRFFDAPPELVFKLWTDPKHLANWWGPKKFSNPECTIDLRPGGQIRIVMQAPDGTRFPMGGEFREIDPPHRLVFTTTIPRDAGGEILGETLVNVTFSLSHGQTKLTIKATVTKATPEIAAALAGMEQGWGQSIDRLDTLIKNVHPEAKEPHYGNGKICYIEIPSSDPQRSADFYKTVFHFKIRTRGDGHLAFDDAVNEVSGSFAKGRKPSTEAGLLIYVMLDSVAATLEQVPAAGGKIIQPIGADHPEITARIADPDGNIIGLYQNPA